MAGDCAFSTADGRMRHRGCIAAAGRVGLYAAAPAGRLLRHAPAQLPASHCIAATCCSLRTPLHLQNPAPPPEPRSASTPSARSSSARWPAHQLTCTPRPRHRTRHSLLFSPRHALLFSPRHTLLFPPTRNSNYDTLSYALSLPSVRLIHTCCAARHLQLRSTRHGTSKKPASAKPRSRSTTPTSRSTCSSGRRALLHPSQRLRPRPSASAPSDLSPAPGAQRLRLLAPARAAISSSRLPRCRGVLELSSSSRWSVG